MPFELSLVPVPRLERCNGSLVIELRCGTDGETRIADLYQRDPCRAMFPLAEPDDIFQAVVLTTSGGLAGGDRIAAKIAAGEGARAIVTTQAAEKIYRSRGEDTAISVILSAGEGSWLEWLPQETILFDGARFRRDTDIEMSETAKVLAAEIVVFGRTAHGEHVATGCYLDRWRLRRAGCLVWADSIGFTDDPKTALGHSAGFGGAVAMATVVYAGPDAAERLADCRQILAQSPTRGGATIANGTLVARILGNDAQLLRKDVAELWCNLREKAGNLPHRLPRIWYI